MKTQQWLCIGISSLFIGLAAIPALSLNGGAVNPPQKGQTWQEFINKHPKVYVEYKYSAHKPMTTLLAMGDKVKLPAGSPVVIKVTETIKSSESTEGASIVFTVVQDVKVGDTVVIKAGSLGQAQVVASEDAGRIGKAGKITVTDFSVRAVDGTFVPLRGTLSTKGDDKLVASGVLAWFICPLFLLMKGGEATIPAGMEKTTYSAADVEVTISKQ